MKTPKFPILIKRGSAVVKIYRSETRGHIEYVVAYYEGQQRKREKFADLAQAKREAAAKATALCNGELDVLSLRSEDKALYVRALNILRPFNVAIDAAVSEYAKARELLGSDSLIEAAKEYANRHSGLAARKTVSDAVEELIESKRKAGKSYSYVNDLKKLRAFSAAFQCQITSVSGAQIDDWLLSLSVSGRSRNNYRSLVQSLMNFAKGKKYLPRDYDELSAVEYANETEGDIEIYTPEEITAFLTRAEAHMIPFLAIGAFAGVRHWEITRLDWSDVKLAAGYIEIKKGKTKTRTRRLAPITENLRKWLLPHAKPSGPICSYRNMSEEILFMAKTLGLPWKRNGLRHSFITYRVADTQNVNQVALEAGNSPGVIFTNYLNPQHADQAKRWFAVEPNTPSKVVQMPIADVG